MEKHKWASDMKLIGIGANNSAFEVEYFKETYSVPFPLFHDGDMAIHTAFGGKIRTPYFLGVKIGKKGDTEIFYTKLGGFENADDFLEVILKASGLP